MINIKIQKISLSNAIKTFLISLCIISFIYLISSSIHRNNTDIYVTVTFVINGIIFFLGLISSLNKYSYSFSLMHWIFCIFFFLLAPLVQYKYNIWPWSFISNDNQVIQTNLMIFLWSIIYILGSKIKIDFSFKYYKIENEFKHTKGLKLFLCISILITLYLLFRVGFLNLMSRSTNSINIDSKMFALLFTNITRAIVTFSVGFIGLHFKKNRKLFFPFIISIICLLICCSPTGLPRYNTAIIYLGLMLLLFDVFKKGNHKILFTCIFIIGFIVIFPVINVFRTVSFNEVNLQTIFNRLSTEFSNTYLSGDYDAYSVVMQVQNYVDSNGLSFGRQLLGALLFFIPRSIWSNKPVGSGQTVFEYFDYKFTNISCPLPSEGYINFGIIGIILFAIIIGIITSNLDRVYWNKENQYSLRYIDFFYPFAILYFFFIMRGDLMATWSYMLSYIVVSFFMFKFLFKEKMESRNDEKEGTII